MFFIIPLAHEESSVRRWPLFAIAVVILNVLMFALGMGDTTFDQRFGFIPSQFVAWTLVTHQFVHAGFFHLALNLWFFWLVGCNLEDRWGKAVFASFYLLSGIAGALLHFRLTGAPDAALIGASGAIAGAMGGFLAVLGATRIRFGYLLWITFKPRVGTFDATAYWMFPLWLVAELCQALFLTDSVRAHWAHVGGFGFGLAVALAMKYSGIDAKLDARAEAASTVQQSARILTAAALSDQGRFDEASRLLEGYLRDTPDDVDALVELVRAVTGTRDRARRVAVSIRLMNAYLAQGFADAAVDVYKELREASLEAEIPQGDAAHLSAAFARRQKNEIALLASRQAERGTHERGENQ